jgi:hypothetical protein
MLVWERLSPTTMPRQSLPCRPANPGSGPYNLTVRYEDDYGVQTQTETLQISRPDLHETFSTGLSLKFPFHCSWLRKCYPIHSEKILPAPFFQSSQPLQSGHATTPVPGKTGGPKICVRFTMESDDRIIRSGPQNRGSFPFDRATLPPQKRGCCKPAILQGQNPFKSTQYGKYSF